MTNPIRFYSVDLCDESGYVIRMAVTSLKTSSDIAAPVPALLRH